MYAIEVDAGQCDACPSEAHVKAFVFVKMPSGRTLSYCGSHGTMYLPELARQAATIVDLRHTIHA